MADSGTKEPQEKQTKLEHYVTLSGSPLPLVTIVNDMVGDIVGETVLTRLHLLHLWSQEWDLLPRSHFQEAQ